MRRIALGVAVVVMAGCLLACGGGSLQRVPVIVEGPKLAALKLEYGPWEAGFPAYSTTIRLPADAGRSLGRDAIRVTCTGGDGMKLKEGHSDHAALKPGESTRLHVYPSDLTHTVRIVLDID